MKLVEMRINWLEYRVLDVNSVFGIKNIKFIISSKKNDQTSAFGVKVTLTVVVNDNL